jgi:hypothetical protein
MSTAHSQLPDSTTKVLSFHLHDVDFALWDTGRSLCTDVPGWLSMAGLLLSFIGCRKVDQEVAYRPNKPRRDFEGRPPSPEVTTY